MASLFILGRPRYRCKYPKCTNVYYTDIVDNSYRNKHFYKFPTKIEFRNQWRRICNISQDVKCDSFRICEEHFEPNHFMNTSKHKLNWNAIPLESTISCVSSNIQSTSEHENTRCMTPLMNINTNAKCDTFSMNVNDINDNETTLLTAYDTLCCTSQTSSNNDSTHISDFSSYSSVTQSKDSSNHENDVEMLVSDKSVQFLVDDEMHNKTMTSKGYLKDIGLSRKELSPKKQKMYKIHRYTISKLSKLRKLLKNERQHVTVLKNLYDRKKLQSIEDSLNTVTKHFIESQIRNANRKPAGRRWTIKDKTFALSLYKRSPRLYKYLTTYFQLPSTRLLKQMLSKIPFETGLNETILENLRARIQKMHPLDRCCALMFDEMSLSSGFHYETSKQQISGYEDLGHLGRTNKVANHALVLMLRGIRKSWKQVIAYYFTANTIPTMSLKNIIVTVISRLQTEGFNVMATICDQGATNRAAFGQLCCDNIESSKTQNYFLINNKRIFIIFDVPHLLKNTRNAMLRNRIKFSEYKEADFDYIRLAFNLDQKRMFKTLPKLKNEYFKFQDSYVKMKVKIAARQLSSSVAAAIESFVAAGTMPAASLYTAEFVQKIDDLFDSLNGSCLKPRNHKKYACALSENSPHLIFWDSMLKEILQWRLIDRRNSKDVTSQYSFINGWIITIQSVKELWRSLNDLEFNFLSLRSLNQDPVENLFCTIRQHGIANANPTCHQFIAALKTSVLNNLVLSINNGNCENDDCLPLDNLCELLTTTHTDNNNNDCSSEEDNISLTLNDTKVTNNEDELLTENSQALAYVAGYILKKITIPQDCETCQRSLFSESTEKHIFISFKEHDDISRLMYPSENVMRFIKNIHECMYKFLDENGHISLLEDRFKIYVENFDIFIQLCPLHNCECMIFDKCVPFFIYKYIKDNKPGKAISQGHLNKIKKWSAMKLKT